LNCDRFPCHFLEQDCSLCFCPFYPCLDMRTGGKEKDGSWCCESCHIIHHPSIAAKVMDELMKGQPISLVWKTLERLL